MIEPDPNPFRPPPAVPAPSQSPTGNPADMSIESEPHFACQQFQEDETEQTAGTGLDPLGTPLTTDDEMEHGIGEEPALRFGGATAQELQNSPAQGLIKLFFRGRLAFPSIQRIGYDYRPSIQSVAMMVVAV